MKEKKMSADFPYVSQFVEIQGEKMHYIERGQGDPILFLHTIPASSYVWRNVIPHVSSLGRCIALDLIGMGKSDKPNREYSVFDHVRSVKKFIETLGLKRLTLVLHGWSSLMGFSYAMEQEKNCKGIVFYESYLRAFNDNKGSLPFQEELYTLHQQENKSDLMGDGLYYIDKLLPREMLRPLTEKELSYYRAPFLETGTHYVLSSYWKELLQLHSESPINQFIAEYSEKLQHSSLPKLMLFSVPGFLTTMETVVWAKNHLSHLEIIEIGEALHYAEESNPDLMGETISVWLQGIEQGSK